MSNIEFVVKRSGAKVPFLPLRITNAIYRAAIAVGGRDRATAEKLSQQVVKILEENHQARNPPTIEDIQDTVEKVLMKTVMPKLPKPTSSTAKNAPANARNKPSAPPNLPKTSLGPKSGTSLTGLLTTVSTPSPASMNASPVGNCRYHPRIRKVVRRRCGKRRRTYHATCR